MADFSAAEHPRHRTGSLLRRSEKLELRWGMIAGLAFCGLFWASVAILLS